MSQRKEFYFHSGARLVFRLSGGFFLGMGLLFILSQLTESDPFKDSDIWFVLIIGFAFALIGLWTILYAQWGRITFNDSGAVISTWIGRMSVRYSDIDDIGLLINSVPYRGLKAYLIRKRTGGMPVNLIVRDGGRMVKSSLVSSFEDYLEIIEEFQNRSGHQAKQITQSMWNEWVRNPAA